MKTPPLLLLLLSCERMETPPPVAPVDTTAIVDTVPDCRKLGTFDFYVSNYCPFNIQAKAVLADTFYTYDIPYDSTVHFPPMPASGFYMVETDKLNPWGNIYIVRGDTCGAFRCMFYPNEAKFEKY